MPKILDHIEYEKTDNGWVSRKLHDNGDFVMDRRETDRILEDIAEIEAGKRPAWTLLGLPEIRVNGEVFRKRDQV
ncbi:MAG: hypothetical protein O3A46_00760 [Candidatus Poribacteria bacterium]|nr:hypothetical protein [Candidatus Poribacteria bacterium]